MIKKLMFAAALAAAGAMPPALASEKCTASADGVWAAAGKGVTVEAFARGATCETAAAAFVVRDETGAIVFSGVYQTDQIMVLAGMKTPKELETALKGWIDPTQGGFETTASLPEWKAGAEAPESQEFPFYPEEGMDQATYTKLRNAKAPLFCFVQGMESTNCLVKDPESGSIFPIGVQTFPG